MNALAVRGEERRGSLRKASGSWQISIDPEVSEWGNPLDESLVSWTEYIGPEKQTLGTETSQYPEEKKSTEISRVVASERERAQSHQVKID